MLPTAPTATEPPITGLVRLSRRAALFFALLTAAIWGTAYVGAKYALRSLPPFAAATSRFLLAVALMWLLLLLTKRAERLEKRDIPLLVAAGLFQTTLYLVVPLLSVVRGHNSCQELLKSPNTVIESGSHSRCTWFPAAGRVIEDLFT